ncbi:MAG: chromosomal replication initiator protein DnaA [Chloroflexota bacterium]|nr:chromosomal replication initiator protein DnaA [Chloroflexota bacterium]
MPVYESAKEIWDAALGELQLQINGTNYDTWLRDTTGLNYEGDQFVVGVASPFAVDYLEQRLSSLIEKTLIGITGEELEVSFQIQQQEVAPKQRNHSKTAKQTNALSYRKNGNNGFNPKYTFDTFIVGSCNRLAEAAARAVSEKPGYIYNPLFIYGGVGLGKTHLLHAIGHAVHKKLNVLYVSTEQFTNEFIKAIREGKTEDFRQKYRSVDVLLIDDIHFIGGKEQTQEGFFHTFNDLHNGSRQIVITSDRPPKSINLLEDRLRSRFEWGLITDVQPPDLETRMAILQAKAEEDKVSIPQDVLHFIAHKIHKSIRELEGSLNRIIAFSRHTDAPITIELASKALDESMETVSRRAPTIPSILNAVARHFDIAPEALTGKRRDKLTAKARHVAVYLLREEAACSFNAIGKTLGNRDHSSIIRGYDKIESEIDGNASLRRDVLEVRDRIYQKGRSSDA